MERRDKINKLVGLLLGQTVQFKQAYLEKCLEYHKKAYNYHIQIASMSYEEKCAKWPSVTSYKGKTFNAGMNKEGYKITEASRKALRLGHDTYVSENLKLNEEHYDNSIVKLAVRVLDKGLGDNITIDANYVDQNINCWVSDGVKTVHCFTVLVCGEVYKPHYRFLIK